IRQTFLKEQIEFRISLPKRTKQMRHQVWTDSRDRTQTQRSRQRSADRTRHFTDLVCFFQNDSCLFSDNPALRSDRDPPIRSLKDLHPQHVLHLANLSTQGGLADMTGSGRFSEVLMVCDSDQIL